MEATYKAVRIKGIDICNDIVMVPDNDNKMFEIILKLCAEHRMLTAVSTI